MDPVNFLKSDKEDQESLWTHLAKNNMDKNASFEENFQNVIAVLGVRLIFNDERRFFNYFKIGFNIEVWYRTNDETFRMQSLYRSKYQKARYKILLIMVHESWAIIEK